MNYENLIDGAEFKTLNHYLNSPDTPIDFVLQLKTRAHLIEIASELGELFAREGEDKQEEFTGIMTKHMNDGSLLISSRDEMVAPFSKYSLPMDSIPTSTWTQVIYMPPLYLAHTPGLFEGIFTKETSSKALQNDSEEVVKDVSRIKRGHSI